MTVATLRDALRAAGRPGPRFEGVAGRERAAAPSIDGQADGDDLAASMTAAQFSRHLAQVIEDQTRRALDRYVGDVGAGEIIDMARNLGQLKARYIGQSLAVATNRQPPSRADAQEMRWMREQIEELELAFETIQRAIASEMIPIRDSRNAPQPGAPGVLRGVPDWPAWNDRA
ncbi:hypothetical protein [Rhodospirillum rubrum]|uniref:Uncharacterized protein n=1 Tax=Rhodospirillum rubrum (strain ATCC 11170 / ATH 1.1.1 / DSM 467 / LMG 4362 / NCIMB 8255 / S1) TaxID=269796 RepID=Q2RWT0_RHORT|nr:hypothetical protein [Rhodospirillum rubrum]ABC21415.1 hypothetical protein Rru_A0611 [Rhodospirillum rubrum ATCC 11170]AEO47095.1 hypothetical protein F11_03125 [Rhodospirillum rubrum F11]MBK5953008.1 hypothetical protein [Rhodospirillum rubrum]QXG81092.1 hypothetical protein KUL73_03170 [Rhodospirillum rubrum]HAP98702.1 hypothetical protein [Rhodospirillum rubrum]